MDGTKSRYVKEKKCWIGIEKKMPEIFRASVQHMAAQCPRCEIWLSDKSNQNIVKNVKTRDEQRDERPNSSECCDESIHIQNRWMEQCTTQQPVFKEEYMDEHEPWLLVGDTILGTTLCEFRSTHEEVDVTS